MTPTNSVTKRSWTAPKLKSIGTIGQVTLATNFVGMGDSIFSVLAS